MVDNLDSKDIRRAETEFNRETSEVVESASKELSELKNKIEVSDASRNSKNFLDSFNVVKEPLAYKDGDTVVSIEGKEVGDLNKGGKGYREIVMNRKRVNNRLLPEKPNKPVSGKPRTQLRDFPVWSPLSAIGGTFSGVALARMRDKEEKPSDLAAFGAGIASGILGRLGKSDILKLQKSKTLSLRRYANGKYELNGVELEENEAGLFILKFGDCIKKGLHQKKEDREGWLKKMLDDEF